MKIKLINTALSIAMLSGTTAYAAVYDPISRAINLDNVSIPGVGQYSVTLVTDNLGNSQKITSINSV